MTTKRPRIRSSAFVENSWKTRGGPHPLDKDGYTVVSMVQDEEEDFEAPGIQEMDTTNHKFCRLETRETLEDPKARAVLEGLKVMVTPVFQRLWVSRALTTKAKRSSRVGKCRVPEVTTWKLSPFTSPRIASGWCRGESSSPDRWEAVVNTTSTTQEYRVVPGSHLFPQDLERVLFCMPPTGTVVKVRPGEVLVLHSRTQRQESIRQGLGEAGMVMRAYFVGLGLGSE